MPLGIQQPANKGEDNEDTKSNNNGGNSDDPVNGHWMGIDERHSS